jgi:hypothetical protein
MQQHPILSEESGGETRLAEDLIPAQMEYYGTGGNGRQFGSGMAGVLGWACSDNRRMVNGSQALRAAHESLRSDYRFVGYHHLVFKVL